MIMNIREQLPEIKKIQLHSGVEGFNSPEIYATYKNTGGDALGVVGRIFEPMDLHLLLDTFESTATECGGLDISKMKYTEAKGGAKVRFELPFREYEIKTPMVGDVIRTSIIVSTGFDGKTKTSLSLSSYRLWCANGACTWEIELAVKNTLKNHVKVMHFCDELYKVMAQSDQYAEKLNQLVTKKVTQKQLDEFLSKLTGYDVKAYADLNTKRRNILDAINASVAIEAQNTGMNQFSLLQGITRYTTHDLCGGDANHEDLFYANAGALSMKAHQLLMN